MSETDIDTDQQVSGGVLTVAVGDSCGEGVQEIPQVPRSCLEDSNTTSKSSCSNDASTSTATTSVNPVVDLESAFRFSISTRLDFQRAGLDTYSMDFFFCGFCTCFPMTHQIFSI